MHAVILSGGVGSRLWPVSRKLHPKPFIKLASGYSILQNTFIRALDIDLRGLLNVTSDAFFFRVKMEWDELFDRKTPRAVLSKLMSVAEKCSFHPHYIIEPFGKNTAAAIAIASLWVTKRVSYDEVILVMPSDHLIADVGSFCSAVKKAEHLAKQGQIVTFGISPDSPETGYGYIEFKGDTVLSFKEKPTLEKAKEYLVSGNYLWNSGMFCFKAGVMLREMEVLCPDILADAVRCFEASQGDSEVFRLEPQTFGVVRDDSIDYAVMEKSRKVSVVACNIGWTDIGNWAALDQSLKKDENGNVVNGSVMLDQVSGCYIEGKDRLIAAVGLENLVIVDTPDALLVANKNHAQDVKNIYNRLARSGHHTHKVHATVSRPWGSYTILGQGENFKVKKLEIKPNGVISLQSHANRSEHWVVISGRAQVFNEVDEFYLETGESTYVLSGHKHRLSNPSSDQGLIILEVQTGASLSEEDIQRYEPACVSLDSNSLQAY